jgi:hypothetical protein
MFTRHVLLIVVVAGLGSGCKSEPPESQLRSGRADDTSAPGSGGGAGASTPGSGSSRHADPNDPERIIETAREGMQLALAKAAELQALRSKQVDKLDRQVERIQQLLDAGKLDEAEVQLVDIHWIPVEPGKHVEADFLRIYDDKRTALAGLIKSRRQRVP